MFNLSRLSLRLGMRRNPAFWGRLQDIAKEMVLPGRFPKDSDAYATGKLYLGLCQIRLRDGEMTENIDVIGYV